MDNTSVFFRNKLFFLNEKFNSQKEILYQDFYEGLSINSDFKVILSKFHCHLNELFLFMNSKGSGGHYNAHESRQLLELIDNYKIIKATVKQLSIDFKLDSYYLKVLEECKAFLRESGGSPIPEDYINIKVIEDKAIFEINDSLSFKKHPETPQITLKNIGGGAYAQVFKFKDPDLHLNFALKKAFKTLSKEEIERFKFEFDCLNSLDSPFIIKAYSFNSTENSYTMEYADFTLDEFISKNNNKLSLIQRKTLITQLLKAFEYIHSKGMLHRDISYKNILVKTYADGTNILKVADLGLIKHIERSMTKSDTEIKGSINDYSDLEKVGFKNYNIYHETYALTKVIYFILKGKKKNFFIEKNKSLLTFLQRGLSNNMAERFTSVADLRQSLFNKVYPYLEDKVAQL